MSIPLREGRNFTPQEAQPNAVPVCIVSAAFVGVAADIRDLAPARDPEPILYVPGIGGAIVLRTAVAPLTLAHAARRIVASIDPMQALRQE
jgi:hypothetical protein